VKEVYILIFKLKEIDSKKIIELQKLDEIKSKRDNTVNYFNIATTNQLK
jgi:hypothetical protein